MQVLSKAEEACYKARYSDLGAKNPTDHFNKIGATQGRSFSCAPLMTENMLTRFGLSTMQVTKNIGANRSPENLQA